MTGPKAAPAPVRADLGIVAAMALEVGFLSDRLSRVRKYAGPGHTVIEGEADDRVIAMIVGGMGRASARRATSLLIDGHRPRYMVSAGFAGALDPTLKRNDAVICDEVIDLDHQRYPVGIEIIRPAGVKTGRILTVDAIVRTAAEKADLRARYGADIVDMETSAVAAVCAERNIGLLSIRIVSDDASADLPKEIATLMSRSGSYRVGAALRALWNRPSSLKDFLALHEHAQEAADRLADVLLAVVVGLPR